MNRYLDLIGRRSSPRTVVISLLLFLGIYAALNFTTLPFSIPALQAASGGKTILNVLPHYDAQTAYAHIAAYTPSAIQIYHRIIAIDLLALIPVYLLFLTSGLLHAASRLFHGTPPAWLRLAALFPLGAALLNIIEDVLIVSLIAAYPDTHESWASIGGYITTTKSALLISAMLLMVSLYFTLALKRSNPRREGPQQ